MGVHLMKRHFALALAALVALSTSQLHAVNLLIQGDFEIGAADPVPDWNLSTVVSGTSTHIGAASLDSNDPIDGDVVLFLKPFVGGNEPGPNNLKDAVLSQIVPVTAGEQYTFTGQSRWETNYSGGVATLSVFSTLGPVASPTDTTMEMQFLNAGGTPVGAPIIKDLRTEQANFNTWVEHMLMGTAPVGATQLRVTAAAREMVYNSSQFPDGPAQAAFWDDFHVFNNNTPASELLLNPSLEDDPPTGLDAWTLTSFDPADPIQSEIIRSLDAGQRTGSPGVAGMWLSSFIGEIATPVDGKVSQIVAATPGTNYTFSGWSKFEPNFPGGFDTVPAGNPNGDSGKPLNTDVFFSIEFLDGVGEVIGSPSLLDIRNDRDAQIPGAAGNGTANTDTWLQHTMAALAPAGTTQIRVTAGMTDGVFTVDPKQSGFFDDFILEASVVGQPGDFDGDDDVDGRDFLIWQRGGSPGGVGDLSDLQDWQANYGLGALAATTAVPEPMTGALVMIGLAAGCLVRGRRA
jgi:hypothetical protein